MKLINCHHIKKWRRPRPLKWLTWAAPRHRPDWRRRRRAANCTRDPPVAPRSASSQIAGGRGDSSPEQVQRLLASSKLLNQVSPRRRPAGRTGAGAGAGMSLGRLLALALMCLIVISDFQQQIANQYAQSKSVVGGEENQSSSSSRRCCCCWSGTNNESHNDNNNNNNIDEAGRQRQLAAGCWPDRPTARTKRGPGPSGARTSDTSSGSIEEEEPRPRRSGGGLFLLAAANSDANRLYEDLMMTYNRIVRPVQNNSDRVVVRLGLKLSQLMDVNLKNQMMTTNVWLNQEWNDYKLKWDPSEYGGIEDMNLPAEQIWLPDIVLYNSAEGYFSTTIMTKAKVRYDGHVTWNPPAIFRSSCQIDITYFPFDSQNCHLKFGSWTYGTKIDLKHINDTDGYIERGTDLSEYYQNVEWDLMEASARRNVITYTCCPNDFYPDVTFNFTLRRKPLFYAVNLIWPCVGITILSFLVFYLPSDSGEKVTLTISILVSLIFFLSVLIETIPSTSLAMPLLGKYLVFTMILITVSVCATVCVLNIHFRTPSTHSMPPWVKRWCIDILPKYLFMTVPQHQSQQANVLPEQLIYPHNQVYWSMLGAPNQPPGGAGSNNNDRSCCGDNNNGKQPCAAAGGGSNRNKQQTTQLNPASLDSDFQKLNVQNSSSLFLPYLQSEAARRLQLQRSRSSDRDQRSECLVSSGAQNNNNNSCDQSAATAVRRQQSSTALDMTQSSSTSSGANSNTVGSTSRAGGQREQKRKSSESGRKKGRSVWSGWFKRKSVAPEVEIHPAEQVDPPTGGGRQSRSTLSKQDTSSSNEADYQHHNHFQARASICSTNLWRIGPTRRCSIAVPSNYPTYYRPQLMVPEVGPDGRPKISTLSGCVQGHYHRRMFSDDTSSESSSTAVNGPNGAIGALIAASATNLPVRPRSIGPSAIGQHQRQQQYQQHDSGQRQQFPECSGLIMQNPGLSNHTAASRMSSLGIEQVPAPNPPPPAPPSASQLLMSDQGLQQQQRQHQLRRQQLMTQSLQQHYQRQQQQPSGGLLLTPARLAYNEAHSSSGQMNGRPTYDGQRVGLSGAGNNPDYQTHSNAHIQLYNQSSCQPIVSNVASLISSQQYQAPVVGQMMPRSRSTDHRLCVYATNASNVYLPTSQEPFTQQHHQLRPTASAQTTASVVYHRQQQPQVYQVQPEPQVPLNQLFATRQTSDNLAASAQANSSNYRMQQPQSIGRALGQAYMQRLHRQPTIYSLNSQSFQRPSRSLHRGVAYPLLSKESQHSSQQHQLLDSRQASMDKMRRSKSQTSLDRRGPEFSGLDCAECNSLRRTESRFRALDSYDSQKMNLDSNCFCDSKSHLNSIGCSALSGGGSLRCRNVRGCSVQRLNCCSDANQARGRTLGCGSRERQQLDRTHVAGCHLARSNQRPPITTLGLMKLISEVDKAIQNAMFIAQHIDNLDEFESVKENWKYIAMVIDRIFLIVFLFACIVGTVTIFAMAPWSYYTTQKPIDLQLTRLLALKLTGGEPDTRTCQDI